MLRKYEVQGRVRTLAKLYLDRKVVVRGYTFCQWEYLNGAPKGGGWHVRAEIEAENIDKCIAKFQSDLIDLTDRIAFLSQCYAACEEEPYLILPLQENQEQEFFYSYSSERGATGLHFNDDEAAALKNLEGYQPGGNVFRLLREATNSPWFYTRFSMLAASLEAIAGSTSRPLEMSVREFIAQSILKDAALTNDIFKYRDGLRNQVLHGSRIDETRHGGIDYIRKIHDCIKRYFQETHGITLNDRVKNPMRHPSENYVNWCGWVKPVASSYEVDLRELWKLSKRIFRSEPGDDENALPFNDVFQFLIETPNHE
ncbi:MAG: hypothetical protein ACFE0S_14120 [Rhodospirillales bacterium]